MTPEFETERATETLLDSDRTLPKLEELPAADEEPGLDKGESTFEDPEVEAIVACVKAMDGETEKLVEMMKRGKKEVEADARSIYVGNVDYGITAAELMVHFRRCGSVNRVTILSDKNTGHPRGFAFVEFKKKASVRTALALDQSVLRGRHLRVCVKLG
ncbi:LOW QUALITY PROTEIN: polyadenylate-binding protein 2-like [Boleophthalmus pectinirostris]|uniref:LOW QUALITY PROTEIN: polyadenylate-binding protein 2-like n=1 Tax=Boleophthalmus pectinirostris TaxID=150288 RepID=UPI00242A4654|nr:LOW QUALITY PROTEIN: polyadenylate-binding protein 2-like [Boleophthalmus pectinirostris]